MSYKKEDSSNVELTGKQKAAILVMIIGPEAASHVFKYLKYDEIEQLSFEIARLDEVDVNTKSKIMEEFRVMLATKDFITKGGVDYAHEILEKSLGSEKAGSIISRLSTSIQTKPFDCIRNAEPAHLLNFIQSEHPQTIALILAFLDPKKASRIISNLPEKIQADVAKRIAQMDRTSPEIVREVERVLDKKISSLSTEDYAMSNGVEAIVDILNFADRGTEKNILENLEEENPDLAEEIKKRMFVFEDIVLLDDRSIQKVLREVDTQELAKALKAVETDVQEKIFRNISKRAQALIKEDMEFMGPIRLKDVEEAQQKIVAIIRKLEEQGEVIIARNSEDELVV